jgi:hypothetical protein
MGLVPIRDSLRRGLIHASAYVSEIVPLWDLERGIHSSLQHPETIRILVKP